MLEIISHKPALPFFFFFHLSKIMNELSFISGMRSKQFGSFKFSLKQYLSMIFWEIYMIGKRNWSL